MNKIDKKFYKALKFLSRKTTPEILDLLLDKNKKKNSENLFRRKWIGHYKFLDMPNLLPLHNI